MKFYEGNISNSLMSNYKSGTAVDSFSDWVANNANIEQFLSIAAMLDPTFYEVESRLFWSQSIAKRVEDQGLRSPVGDEPSLAQRYLNVLNLDEFFLLGYTESQEDEKLIAALASCVENHWDRSLQLRFPSRKHIVEVQENLFDESGLCVTFFENV